MEQSATTRGVGMQYGVIAGVIMIIYFLILQFSGLALETWASVLTYIILAVVIFLAHSKFKEGDGFMTYGQGLAIGFWTSLTAGVINSVFSFIYISFVDNSFIEEMKEKARYDMEEQGIPESQIEMSMGWMDTMMSPGMMFVMGIVGVVFAGFIISLIVAAITKKTNPQLEV